MELSHELMSQFAKLVTKDKKATSESTVYGTVVVDGNGNKYVKLDGSDQLTPLSNDERPAADTTVASANDGERVSVLIKNHTATVTGNVSSPAARTGDVEELGDQVTKIQEFGVLIGERVEANEGYIKQLQTDTADIGELRAATAKIGELEADNATIHGELEAAKADIGTLEADNVTVNGRLDAIDIVTDNLEADNATIHGELEAAKADIGTLEADNVTVKNELVAARADISALNTDKLDATEAEIKYANIDFTNIGDAAIENLYAKSGIIKDLVVENGTVVTGELVGVTIKGDLIQGGTVVADKLVIKGEDGLYYKINTEAVRNGTMTDAYVKMEEMDPPEGDLYCIVETGYIKTEDIIPDSSVEKTLVEDLYSVSGEQVYAYIDSDGEESYCCSEVTIDDNTDTEITTWYVVEVAYVETSAYIDAVEGTIVDGIHTSSNEKVYVYTDDEGTNMYYCRLNKMLEDTFTTTYEQVYTYSKYIDSEETKHFYCIVDVVYYSVDSEYVKTSDIIDPVEGTAVENTVTTTGEQVYTYTDTDGVEHMYCMRERVYFSVVVNADSIELEQTDKNSLDGSVITAKTITATQISVSDLVAFDATIGGFTIDDNSISSTVKDSEGNSTRGIYFDNDGQVNIGDANNYIKYLRNVTPIYTKTEDKIKFAVASEFSATSEKITGLSIAPNPSSLGKVVVDGTEYDVYKGSTSSGYVYFYKVRTSTSGGTYTYTYYRVNLVYTKLDVLINVTGGTVVDGTTTSTGEQVYSYADENGDEAFYCQSDTTVVDGTAISGTLTTTEEQVFTYTDSAGTIIFYCVVDSVYYLVDYAEDISYSLVISASSVLYAMNGSQYSLSDLGAIGEYVKIGIFEDEPCIELGESDSNFKLIITNTRILFLDGTKVPAYFTNEALHIEKATIEDELRFGQFVWQIRPNGNMGLVWQETAEEVAE